MQKHTLPSGNTYLEKPCETWKDWKDSPDIIEYQGHVYSKAAFDSGTCRAFYRVKR